MELKIPQIQFSLVWNYEKLTIELKSNSRTESAIHFSV